LAGEAGAQRNHAVGDACVVDGVVEAIGESGGLQRRVQFEIDGD